MLSIPKMYLDSGGASKIFLTMRARSLTWIVGTLFLPSPMIGSFVGSCFQARSKWWLKMASPKPYRTPAEMTYVLTPSFLKLRTRSSTSLILAYSALAFLLRKSDSVKGWWRYRFLLRLAGASSSFSYSSSSD